MSEEYSLRIQTRSSNDLQDTIIVAERYELICNTRKYIIDNVIGVSPLEWFVESYEDINGLKKPKKRKKRFVGIEAYEKADDQVNKYLEDLLVKYDKK